MELDFSEIQELFDLKNKDYGDSWRIAGKVLHALGMANGSPLILSEETDFINYGIFVVAVEKMCRIAYLAFKTNGATAYESIEDSCNDLSVVAQMFRKAYLETKLIEKVNK